MLGGFIDDGYTEAGFIRAEPGLFDCDLRFAYRPMLPEERDSVAEGIERRKAHEAVQLVARTIAAHVSEWDLRDAKGEPVPVGERTIRRLRPRLFDRLYFVISGRQPSDPDPTKPGAGQDQEGDSYAERLMRAQEADQKNS